jgi:hypothetical protein
MFAAVEGAARMVMTEAPAARRVTVTVTQEQADACGIRQVRANARPELVAVAVEWIEDGPCETG